jgi:hypothetical protein
MGGRNGAAKSRTDDVPFHIKLAPLDISLPLTEINASRKVGISY